MNAEQMNEVQAPEAVREAMPLVPSGPCWICGGSERDRVWSDPFDLTFHPRFGRYAHGEHPDTWLVRCRSCGFAQPEAMPAPDDYFDLLYADQPWLTEEHMAEVFDDGLKDAIFRQVLDGLERHKEAGAPRSVLDVGSYIGRFLQVAHDRRLAGRGGRAEHPRRRLRRPPDRPAGPPDPRPGPDRPRPDLRRRDVDRRPRAHPPPPAPRRPAPRAARARRRDRDQAPARAGPAKERDEHRVNVMARFVHVNHFTVGSLRRCLESAGFAKVHVTTAAPEFRPPSPTRTEAQARSAMFRRAVFALARAIPGGVYTPLAPQLIAFAVNRGPAPG